MPPAHNEFGITMLLHDNLSVISLDITLFSYHNGPFKLIFFSLRRHIGRAPVLIAESLSDMCYQSLSGTKCISGRETLNFPFCMFIM